MSCNTLDRAVGASAATEPCNPRGCALLCTREGLATAYDTHRARMLARARTVVVDPHLAEEAVQEAFLRAWRNCASFDPSGAPLVHWLLVITRNAAIDMVKARARRPPVVPEMSEDRAESPPDGISDTDRVVLRDELSAALAVIGPEHRHAVVEIIVRDRPYAAVAADLGIPPGTVRSRVHYALRRLRDLMRGEVEA